MRVKTYKEMLLERASSTFAKWSERGQITEEELYRFVHTLKGTSGTIGLDSLSEFCSSQLEILSADKDTVILVESLENFSNRILYFLEGEEEAQTFVLPELYQDRFDEDTFVLIIDDDLEFVSYVKELLEKMGAQVVIALNGKRGLDLFYSMRPNFVLIDLILPDMTGFEFLDQIKETARARHITLAIASVNDSRKNRIKAYERGAMDFIAKPLDTDIFIPYLLNREKMRKEIDETITTDGLTGVGNRRHFDDVLSHFEEYSNRFKRKFVLVLLDLDHFKEVNDQYGHQAGDEVLRKFGEIAKKTKRDSDYVFRYGGEEFTFILNGVTEEDAYDFVERLRKNFNQIRFQEDQNPFSVNFSVGIATYEGNAEKLLSRADQALYKAKRSGRNRTVIFDPKAREIKRKLNILIVDDDSFVRRILEEKLSQWKMDDVDVSIQTFKNGPSFLKTDWYRPEDKFIVLLDGIMPEMDGLEVLVQLKKDYDEKNVMVSMMTARTGEADIKDALSKGADDYIVKPFLPSDILARIQQLSARLFK